MTEKAHVQVALDIDLDYPLREEVIDYHDDGSPAGMEILTLGDAITDRAAHLMVEKMFNAAKDHVTSWDRYGKAFFEKHIQPQLDKRIDALLAEAIDGLDETMRVATGKATLNEALAAIVDKHLNTANYGRKSKLAEEVDKAVGPRAEKEVEAAIANAKRKVIQTIAKVGEERLGEALREAIATNAGVKL